VLSNKKEVFDDLKKRGQSRDWKVHGDKDAGGSIIQRQIASWGKRSMKRNRKNHTPGRSEMANWGRAKETRGKEKLEGERNCGNFPLTKAQERLIFSGLVGGGGYDWDRFKDQEIDRVGGEAEGWYRNATEKLPKRLLEQGAETKEAGRQHFTGPRRRKHRAVLWMSKTGGGKGLG